MAESNENNSKELEFDTIVIDDDVPPKKGRVRINLLCDGVSKSQYKLIRNFTDRSIHIELQIPSSGVKYVYDIKKLPFDIQGERCTCQVKNKAVIVSLKKVDKQQSWTSAICSGTLETSDI